jgi:glycosyltransferase involved in cell wall biosynthesis
MLTVLSVAYPLSPVRPDTSGGAEQVLAMLDEALVREGHCSIVIASEGSRVAGTLVATPRPGSVLDQDALLRAQERHYAAVRATAERGRVDLVHMHGQDFQAYLPPTGTPVLVTLHVPREWYGPQPFDVARPGTFFNCVSESQRAQWTEGGPAMLDTIENGVPVDRYRTHVHKRDFVLALGRIAPEKGTHIALAAAELAGAPLIIAGEVYRYPEHERYFREKILPRLSGTGATLAGPVGFDRKRRLIAAARCVLIPSQAPETSSLVAMEALACGTPVIAYPAGALAGIVEHERTGFLVRTPGEMAFAIRAVDRIDPAVCRAAARRRFSAARMVERYFDVYRQLAQKRFRVAS